jgi:parallel beta-helix repeat protein
MIQAAINAAKPGDTVYVRHGTYNQALKFKEGITLQGEDPETTIVRYSTTPTGTTGQSHYDSPLEVRDCKTGIISDLTFRQEQVDTRDGKDYWKADAVTIWHSSITMRNCRATSAAATGIAVYSSSTATLIGNQCRSNAWSGIIFYSGSNGTAEANICENNGLYGIYVGEEGTTAHLKKNVCEANGSCGITFRSGAQGEAIQNTCRQNKWDGISAADASPTLNLNVLVKNARYGISCNSNARPMMLGNQFDGNGKDALFMASPTPTPHPSLTASLKSTPDPFSSPFGPFTLPSPFTFVTPTPTPVTAPSPKSTPKDWWRLLLSPSPTPTTGLINR